MTDCLVCMGRTLRGRLGQVIYISTEVGASFACVTKLKLQDCLTDVVSCVH